MGSIVGKRSARQSPREEIKEPTPIPFGIWQEQGRRKRMEDYAFGCSMLSENQPELATWLPGGVHGIQRHGAFCVMDGHGGMEAADLCSRILLKNILEANFKDNVNVALKEGFAKTEEEIYKFCLEEDLGCGCTCVMALVLGEAVFVSHVGDSLAIVDRSGSPVVLTTPHLVKANKKEKDRLVELGVTIGPTGRIIHPMVKTVKIQVTRSFGDVTFKDPELTDGEPTGVISDPDVRVDMLYPSDNFLLLASDGVFDVMSVKKATSLVAEKLLNENATCEEAAHHLVDYALEEGTQDNVTVIVVDIRPQGSS